MHSPVLYRDFPTPRLTVPQAVLANPRPELDPLRAAVNDYDDHKEAAHDTYEALDDHLGPDDLKAQYRQAVHNALLADKKPPAEPNYVVAEETGRVLEARHLRALAALKKAARAVDEAVIDARPFLRESVTPLAQQAIDKAPTTVAEVQAVIGQLEGFTRVLLAADLAAAGRIAADEGLSADGLRESVHDADGEARNRHLILTNPNRAVTALDEVRQYVEAVADLTAARLADPLETPAFQHRLANLGGTKARSTVRPQ